MNREQKMQEYMKRSLILSGRKSVKARKMVTTSKLVLALLVLTTATLITMATNSAIRDHWCDMIRPQIKVDVDYVRLTNKLDDYEWGRLGGQEPTNNSNRKEVANRMSAEEGLSSCYSPAGHRYTDCTGYSLPTEAEAEYLQSEGIDDSRRFVINQF